MFLNEARITAQIQHKNVVRIFELGNQNGEPFIAMELLEEGEEERTHFRPTRRAEQAGGEHRLLAVSPAVTVTSVARRDAGTLTTGTPPDNAGCGCSSTETGMPLPFALATVALRRGRSSNVVKLVA